MRIFHVFFSKFTSGKNNFQMLYTTLKESFDKKYNIKNVIIYSRLKMLRSRLKFQLSMNINMCLVATKSQICCWADFYS